MSKKKVVNKKALRALLAQGRISELLDYIIEAL